MIKNWLNKYLNGKWVGLIVFYLFVLGFLWLNGWLVVKKDTLLGSLIPIVLAVLIAAILSYNKIIWAVVLLAPLSIPLRKLVYGLPFDMFIPTEPLMFGLLLLFVFSVIRGNRIDKEIVRHPIAIAIYVYLGWIAFTSITSTLPMVSLKFFLNRLWYVVIFFFLFTFLFKKQSNIEKFVWMFAGALVLIIFYTLTRHYIVGFHDDKAAHWVMSPFFNDHTSYGAVLAMMIPFLVAFSFSGWLSLKHRLWGMALLSVFVVGELMSFSRAAWLSLIIGAGVLTVIKLKIKFRTLLITALSILAVVFIFEDQIVQTLERNSTDSSNNLADHITSAYNISTDASNLERLNRWQCAFAMFKEKPILGWGPGTYAMNYAPFQLTGQRTIISTNSGDGGNAHSEYLGALAETGVMGTLSFLILISVVLYVGINAFIRTNDKRMKTLLLASIVSLVTYYVHSFLNNFLDVDKAAIPFWGFTAIIAAIDIYIKQQEGSPDNTLQKP